MSLDIFVDSKTGTLVQGGSAPYGTLPVLTRNDTYNIRIRPQQSVNNIYYDSTYVSPTFKLGIGFLDLEPASGSFKLTTPTGTSGAIAYNASTAAILTAVSGIAGNVTVATFGGDGSAWLITAATANTALSFSGSSFSLFPPCDVLIGTRLNYSSGVCAQVTVALHRSPAVYADSFSASSTAGQIALSLVNQGTATANETYQLVVGSDVDSGTFVLNYGGTATTAIFIGQTAASFAAALEAINAISTGNIAVAAASDYSSYNISFVGALGYTAITTALTLDATNVVYAKYYQSTVTMNTAEVEQLFSETTADFIEPILEIEIVDGGTRQTALHTPIKLRRDLITSSSAIPTPQANFLTSSESYAAFLPTTTTAFLRNATTGFNVSGFNRSILNSSGVTRLSVSLVGLGFFGTTPVAQPANTNVISALVNLGLIANTVTVGVADVPTNVVTDWTGNVSATTRFLADSSAVTSADYGNRVLKNSSGVTAVNWETGVFGSGSTVVTIAANNVTISGSYYIAMGTANGAFRTLSTLASVTFGSVAGNDQHYRDVVVTGASVNDIVLIGLPSAVSAGAVIQGVAYKANTVCLSCTNADTGPLAINTATYRITVLDYQ
jgi:hypothetical protein